MKVMIVNQHISDGIGGSEMQCHIIAKGLTEKRHDVVYAVVGNRSKKSYPDLSYIAEPLDVTNKEAVRQFLLRHDPDVVYWRYNKNHLKNATGVFRSLSIPFVFAVSHINDLTPLSFKPRHSCGSLNWFRNRLSYSAQMFRSFVNFQALKSAAALTTLNRSYLPLSPVKKSVAIWNSVEEDVVAFAWERPYICWVANIKADKRPEAFIRLASQISPLHPEIDFLMIGDIRQKAYEKVVYNAQQELKNFHFLGPKSPAEVNGILKDSLFLVHTCHPEGFGNNFIQAWMQGKPTVSLGFDPDGLITEEGLGFVSDDRLSKMVVDTNTLIESRILREESGLRAQEFAYNNFTQEKLLTSIESVLQYALRERK